MKNIYRSGILLGMGILCAGTFAATDSASAAPRRGDRDVREDRKEVKEARKDVREERRDLRQADTPRERAEERRELWDAQRDLQREKQGLRRERWDDNRHDNDRRDNDRRDGRWDDRRDGRWNNGNWGNYPSRPGYYPSQPGYGYGYPNYNNNHSNFPGRSSSTVEGVVINDLDGNDFVIRTSNGRQIRVIAQRGESARISRGDVVRVYGYNEGGTFRAQNVSIIRNR